MICISIGNSTHLQEVNKIKPDLVEIRYDLIDDQPDDIERILDGELKQIATCRPGKYTEDERLDILKNAIKKGASFVDIEYEASHYFIDQIVGLCKNKACEVIVSYHNFTSTPGFHELSTIMNTCYEKGGDIAKIACTVNEKNQIAPLLSLYMSPGRKVVLGMGDLGKITRISALELGAEFTFVSLSRSDSTAPGQLTYDEFQTIINILNSK